MCQLHQKSGHNSKKKYKNWVYIISFFLHFEYNGIVIKKMNFFENLYDIDRTKVVTLLYYPRKTRNHHTQTAQTLMGPCLSFPVHEVQLGQSGLTLALLTVQDCQDWQLYERVLMVTAGCSPRSMLDSLSWLADLV